jgi:hypothetical protein
MEEEDNREVETHELNKYEDRTKESVSNESYARKRNIVNKTHIC